MDCSSLVIHASKGNLRVPDGIALNMIPALARGLVW